MNENLPTISGGSGNTIQDESQPTGLISVSSGSMKERKAGPTLRTGHRKADINVNRILSRAAGPVFLVDFKIHRVIMLENEFLQPGLNLSLALTLPSSSPFPLPPLVS